LYNIITTPLFIKETANNDSGYSQTVVIVTCTPPEVEVVVEFPSLHFPSTSTVEWVVELIYPPLSFMVIAQSHVDFDFEQDETKTIKSNTPTIRINFFFIVNDFKLRLFLLF